MSKDTTKEIKEIKDIIKRRDDDRVKVINMILKYLDKCNKELDFDIEYYGETIRISEIKNKMLISSEDLDGIVGEHDGNKIDYRDMDYDEIIDLFYNVAEF